MTQQVIPTEVIETVIDEIYENESFELINEVEKPKVLRMTKHLVCMLSDGRRVASYKLDYDQQVKVRNTKTYGFCSVSDTSMGCTGVSEETLWYPFDLDEAEDDPYEQIKNLLEMISEAYYAMYND